MTDRRAAAARLIEWTGERFVPWVTDAQVAYEHFHRYLWAAELAEGKRVLDLGSGEGFGSAILAGRAAEVRGVDLDPQAVEHSRINYSAENLDFTVGSMLELEKLELGSFDLVVAFEVIEHVAEHERLLEQIKSVLGESGVLVMSTPDRRLYSDVFAHDNPFHERELDEDEFRALLAGHFANVECAGQRAITGSHIRTSSAPDEPTPASSYAVEWRGDGWQVAGPPTPLYLLAVASDAPAKLPSAVSTLGDYQLELMRIPEREAAAAAEALAEHERSAAAEREALHADVRRIRDHYEQSLREQRRLAGVVGALNQDVLERDQGLVSLEGRIEADRQKLRRVEESVVWNTFQRARGRFYAAIGGERSLAARATSRALRTLGRSSRRRTGPAPAPVEAPPKTILRLPEAEAPVVSLIMPVYAQAELTERALRSLVASTEAPSYEVVLVDDTADAATKRLIEGITGATVVVNETNQHFLRSMNSGAEVARGKYLVLCNNDVEFQPGWLEALVNRAESSEDIGIVTPKFLFEDRGLQEAGGIVFRDGHAWNYGRGHDPEGPEYNFVREVDYGTAAALLVRADLFRRLGGFDERYAPIYYEDTDLCFAARADGMKVVYEPAAEVVHLEGATSGTDLGAGSKRYQVLNHAKFAEKWRAELEAQPRFSDQRVRRASDRRPGRGVIVIDHRLPTPDRDSGSLRMFHILKALHDQGCRVIFVPDNFQRHEPYTSRLQALGIEVWYGPVNVIAHLASVGPHVDLAILSRPHIAPRYIEWIREWLPAATLAYDTVDLHHVREQRRMELAGRNGSLKGAAVRELELALMRACDVTIAITDEEREYIGRTLPGTEIVVMPNAHRIATDVAPPGEREGLLFVGGFEHPPNVDAAVYLVERVMPLVWQHLGDVELTIVGADAPPEVNALAGPDVNVLGWVPDMAPLLRESRVMVAPLRYGAGMKGKVTQSLATGLPVVTTTIGAEGLDAVDGEDLLIGDDPAAFAAAIARAYRDDELWLRLSAAGQKVIQRVASVEILDARLRELLESGAQS